MRQGRHISPSTCPGRWLFSTEFSLNTSPEILFAGSCIVVTGARDTRTIEKPRKYIEKRTYVRSSGSYLFSHWKKPFNFCSSFLKSSTTTLRYSVSQASISFKIKSSNSLNTKIQNNTNAEHPHRRRNSRPRPLPRPPIRLFGSSSLRNSTILGPPSLHPKSPLDFQNRYHRPRSRAPHCPTLGRRQCCENRPVGNMCRLFRKRNA